MTIEFELVVYITMRLHENMDEFLEKYWMDHSFLVEESLELEYIFKKLGKQILWDNQENMSFTLSELSNLFQPKKIKKSSSEKLKKYSFVEFLQRQSQEKTYTSVEKPFLSNEVKMSKINLSERKFKIIDYGNCYDYSDERYGLINTRQYRAPEVILSKKLN